MSDDYLKDLSSTCLENEKVKSMGKKKNRHQLGMNSSNLRTKALEPFNTQLLIIMIDVTLVY